MEAEPYLKRKGLIGVLHHEINKTKSVPEVLKIIKFIEEHKKNFRFMRDNLLHDDWKSLRQTAFQQINKIASLQQDIVFSNVNESVEVKNFMKAETKYHFFQKKTYDLLVKDKIKVLTEESITKNILAQ
jgi:hypothetical protein